MIKKLKSFALKLAAAALLVAPLAVPTIAYAEIEGGLNCGSNFDIAAAGPNGSCTVENTGDDLNNMIEFGVNLFSIIVGIIAVVMIIVGGLKYVTSGGDSGDITGAKNTIMYAVIGLVVVALAQFIVHFVLTKTTSTVSGDGGVTP